MDNTPLLALPLLANKQALQTTFHDDAIKTLDSLVMLSVIDRDLSSPPASPSEGDRYIVKAPGSGDDAWQDDHVVAFIDGHWRTHPPQLGWTCYVQDESALIAWDGAAWQFALDVLGGGTAQNLSLLGVGTMADATNPVSAKLNNTLWVAKTVAEGGDGNLRYKLSKESAAKTLSFLLQNNFSGRAEIGLAGDDDLHFKVSPDGSSWIDAIVVSGATGKTRLLPDDAMLGFSMINGTLVASAASGALTIAIKTRAGGDPSASNPVSVVFRNPTAATGNYEIIQLAAATSFVISSGSTMGVASNTAFRLWLVGFNDGGTFRLGAINCSTATAIFSLVEGIASAAAEGGAGAADSAGVVYAGASVSSQPMRILGYLEWSSSGLTAGTWTTTNLATIQLFGPGTAKPGEEVQSAADQTGAVATGTTTVPLDDTIPQITEGDQYLSKAIVPSSACNILEIEAQLALRNTSAGSIIVSLFQDSTTDSLATVNRSTAAILVSAYIKFQLRAGTVSSTTFKVRAGSNAAGTTTFNGSAGSRLYGGVSNSFIKIRELQG